jgi:hypothetical protein
VAAAVATAVKTVEDLIEELIKAESGRTADFVEPKRNDEKGATL